jgi:hypothetical protein
MIQRDSVEWKILMKKIALSKANNHRDAICMKCWVIMTYMQAKIHKVEVPEHSYSLVTSKNFSSESKYIALCKAAKK